MPLFDEYYFVMKNPFKKKAPEDGEEQASPKPKKEKAKSKKDVGKTSSADSAQAEKILKKKKKNVKKVPKKDKTVKKEKLPPARLVAANEAAPSDDDPNSPGGGGELTLEQIAVLKQVLGLKSQKQIEKFESNFTPEEIARVKKDLNDPSKRKVVNKKKLQCRRSRSEGIC